MEPWEDKAHRIIAALCRAEHEKANRLPNGKLRKKHVPYPVPDAARALVAALGSHDDRAAKAVFLFDYDVQQLPR